MDLVHDRAGIIEEEDRISNLPDDIIHRILSFLDMKYAVQTCTLSKKWKHIWTSMPYLNLNSRMFHTMPQFAKFVKHALSHRNNHTEVSSVELTFTGPTTQFVIEDIVNYAYLYNVRQLTLIWFTGKFSELPQYLFSSHTLKHLTLNDQSCYHRKYSRIPKSAWDFPALETLNLSNMSLGDVGDKSLNLFSKCVNLKDITLHGFYMHGLEIFNVCAPQLLNLTITDFVKFPNIFNVIAPKLKNLTATVNRFPNYFNAVGPSFLPFSTEGFSSLDKVNLSFSKPSDKKERHVPGLLKLFQILRSAKFLILDVDIIESLSSCLDQLSREPCPFNKLKCLKINMMPLKQNNRRATIPVHVKNYLLENSRSATFIMDFPQKRSRKQVHKDTKAKKVAKLETEKQQPETISLQEKSILEANVQMQDQVTAHQKTRVLMQYQVTGQQMMKDQIIAQQKAKIQMQDQIIAQQKAKIQMQNQVNAKQKAMLEALKLSHIIKCKIAELKLHVESGNPDNELIRSMGCDIKSVLDLIPESSVAVKERFSSLYEELNNLFLTRIDASHWAMIQTKLGHTMDSDETHSNNINSKSHVPAAELSPVPKPSSADENIRPQIQLEKRKLRRF